MPELKLIHNHENYRSLHVVTLTLPMCLNIQQFLKTIFEYTTQPKYHFTLQYLHLLAFTFSLQSLCLQCFDTVGWVSGRFSSVR